MAEKKRVIEGYVYAITGDPEGCGTMILPCRLNEEEVLKELLRAKREDRLLARIDVEKIMEELRKGLIPVTVSSIILSLALEKCPYDMFEYDLDVVLFGLHGRRVRVTIEEVDDSNSREH